jgi:hypothetical protein
MTLTNPSDKKICFKIKTTAPKKYCVRPNSGVVDARGVVDVAGKVKSMFCVLFASLTSIFSWRYFAL